MSLTPEQIEANKVRLDAFIDGQIKHLPIENKILKKIVKALAKAGNPVVSVWDGEEDNKVSGLREIQVQVFNLDSCHLYTESDGWVFLVLGNGWDTLSDYTVSLEDTLKETMDWISKNMD